MLEERARGAGMRLAEWVREALLAAPVEPGVDSGAVALAEVHALRSLLLNLHFRAAKGEPVTGGPRLDSETWGAILWTCRPLNESRPVRRQLRHDSCGTRHLFPTSFSC